MRTLKLSAPTSIVQKGTSRWYAFGTFFLCALLLYARGRARILDPGLWAEDGALFLADGLHYGIGAIAQIYCGYYHTLPRLATQLFLTVAPLAAFPYLDSITCLLLYAFVVSTFASEAYAAYVPSRPARVLTALMLCLLPGLAEVAGNLANIHWVCYLYIWLLLIKPASERLRWWEVALSSLFIFSTGETIVTLPLLSWRMFGRWRRGERPFAEAWLALLITVQVGLSIANPWREPAAVLDSLTPTFFSDAAHYMFRVLGLEPWYAAFRWVNLAEATNRLVQRNVVWALALWMVYRLWRRPETRIIGLGLFCALGIPVLTWIVRPGAAGFFFGRYAPQQGWEFLRYSFVMAPFVLIGWMSAFRPERLFAKERFCHVAVIFLVIYGLSWGKPFVFKSFHVSDWATLAAQLEERKASCSGTPFVIPISPPNWGVIYDPAKDVSCARRATASGIDTARSETR